MLAEVFLDIRKKVEKVYRQVHNANQDELQIKCDAK